MVASGKLFHDLARQRQRQAAALGQRAAVHRGSNHLQGHKAALHPGHHVIQHRHRHRKLSVGKIFFQQLPQQRIIRRRKPGHVDSPHARGEIGKPPFHLRHRNLARDQKRRLRAGGPVHKVEQPLFAPAMVRRRVVEDQIGGRRHGIDGHPGQGDGIGLFRPNGRQMALAAGLRADKVQDAVLARPVRPAVDPGGGKAVAVAKDEILAARRRDELEIKRKLRHGMDRVPTAPARAARRRWCRHRAG